MLYFATSAQQGMLCKLAGPINRAGVREPLPSRRRRKSSLLIHHVNVTVNVKTYRQDLRQPGSWAMYLDVLESTQSFLAHVLS